MFKNPYTCASIFAPRMSVQDLLLAYQKSPRLFSLADKLSFSQPQNIYAKNLRGSSAGFVAASVFLNPLCKELNHLFVCNDEEEAAYFHNTLENLTQALNIYYFPSSFKNKKNYRLLNSSHVMLRTEALTKFSSQLGSRTGALVTYPDAVFEKVVVPNAISSNIISIKTGDVLKTDELYERLVNYGFERTDFVYEPGQFAVRGGIMDIYSFGNEKPYRIELFGNDVDSIRIIDPETQLSERRLLNVNIIPNLAYRQAGVDMQFEDEDKISILEFLPQNTIVWLQDEEFTKERLLICGDDLTLALSSEGNLASSADEENPLYKKEIKADDFITAGEFSEQLISSSCIG
jgi:transcription-repair coupling factor (superfamily II helicase)